MKIAIFNNRNIVAKFISQNYINGTIEYSKTRIENIIISAKFYMIISTKMTPKP